MKNVTHFTVKDVQVVKNMTDSTWHAIVVTALCNQPEAFASDLGDDQSQPEHREFRARKCF